jgi:hypothetical protein
MHHRYTKRKGVHDWHIRLLHHTCRDDHQLAAMQGFMQLCWACVAFDLGSCADMAEVAGDSCCVCNIIQTELANKGAVLEQQGQGLADPTSCSQYSYLGLQQNIPQIALLCLGPQAQLCMPCCVPAELESAAAAVLQQLMMRTFAPPPGRKCAAIRFTRSISTGKFGCCQIFCSVHPVRVPEVINSSQHVVKHARGRCE